MISKSLISYISLLLACQQISAGNVSSNANSVSVDSLLGKNMGGYVGWYKCENGTATHHWAKRHPTAGFVPVVDLLPDVSEYDQNDLCILPGYHDSKGDPIKVFSSESPGVVDTHFKWMQQYGIDGAYLHGFLSEMNKPDVLKWRLKVTENFKNSAEKYGRVWAIKLDVTGSAENSLTMLNKILPSLETLIRNSSMYLHENGKPLIALWGFGGEDGRHVSNATYGFKLVQSLKQRGFSVLGGMARNTWKSQYNKDPAWKKLVNSLDAMIPWMAPNASDYAEIKKIVEDDLKLLSGTNVIYSPFIAPGFSWHNLKQGEKKLNDVPRDGGNYYMKRVNASIAGGARAIYTGQFDECNEGGAIFKTLAKKKQLPTKGQFLSLDIDGYDLDSDHYLKLAGQASSKLKTAQQSA